MNPSLLPREMRRVAKLAWVLMVVTLVLDVPGVLLSLNLLAVLYDQSCFLLGYATMVVLAVSTLVYWAIATGKPVVEQGRSVGERPWLTVAMYVDKFGNGHRSNSTRGNRTYVIDPRPRYILFTTVAYIVGWGGIALGYWL